MLNGQHKALIGPDVVPQKEAEVDQVPVFVVRLEDVDASSGLPASLEALDFEGRLKQVMPLWHLGEQNIQQVIVRDQLIKQRIDHAHHIRVAFC